MFDRHIAQSLDRHITGNYGEDQFRDEPGHIEMKLDFISVEEGLPNNGESAFIIVPYMNFPYMAYRKGGRWMWAYSVNKPVELEVTHWAAVPTIKD